MARTLKEVIVCGGCGCPGCVEFATRIWQQEVDAEIAAEVEREEAERAARRAKVAHCLKRVGLSLVLLYYVLPLCKVVGDFWGAACDSLVRSVFCQ